MSDNNKKNKISSLKEQGKILPIILYSAAALIIAMLLFGSGALGGGIKGLLKGLFGFGAFVIPAALLVHGICLSEDVKNKSIKRRVIFSLVTLIVISCIDYAIFTFGNTATLFPAAAFVNMNGGGFVGNILGFVLSKLFGQVGVIIVCVAALAIYATFFYAEKAGSLGQAAIKVKNGAKKVVDGLHQKHNAAIEKKKELEEEEKRQKYEAASAELMSDDFFTTEGSTYAVKIKKLGIDEEHSPSGASSLIHPSKRHYDVEQENVNTTDVHEEKVERPRRSADKPLDLSYGMDEGEINAGKPTKKEEFNKAFFGIDDSADNVFTRDFDPFDFATGEKTAAKYANKVSTIQAGIEEELDEFTIYEMKANHVPSEREKRLMELERRKQEWLYEKRKREEKASGSSTPKVEEPVKVNTISLFDSVTDPTVKKAPAFATSAAAFGAAYDRPRNNPQPVSNIDTRPTENVATTTELTSTPTTDDTTHVKEQTATTSVNAYTSYSTTKTTYHQPIKTVEFTITKEPKAEEPVKVEKNTPVTEEATEDVAILIAERIARQTPGYQRSANDLKTYTKVVSTGADDELFRQLNGNIEAPAPIHTPIVDESQPVPTPEIVDFEVVEEPKLPDPVEFSFGQQDSTYVPSPKDSYQRAAEFVATMVSNNDNANFKSYNPPTSAVLTNDGHVEENSIKVERSMISPTPEVRLSSQPETVEFEPLFDVANDEEQEMPNVSTPDDVDFSKDILPDEDIEEDDDEFDGEELPEEDDAEDEEIPPEKQNPDVIEMRKMFPFLATPDEQIAEAAKAKKADKPAPTPISQEPEIADVPFDDPTPVKAEPKKTALVSATENKPEKKKPDYSDYVFPDINLLTREESLYDENIQIEIQENADKLIETLASFNVTASIKGVDRGPRITRYEVVPAKGVKVSQILNLQDDIALNLAAGDIRMEAPIPGKSAVGIEVPNKKSSIVRLRELLETSEFKYSKSKTLACIGRDIAGQPVFGDLASMPHLLIAGATGMGKSVCINSLLISILYKAKPDEVKFIMIDPKQVEFTMYDGIPHLLVPVVSDPKKAAGALMWAVEEMERRFDALKPLGVRNADAYNEKVAADPSLGSPMSKIIIVIDEFADLMLQVKDPVESLVMRIAQKARAAGIHLVIGTQRPSVNVITGVIKANIPSRISCKVMSNVDSKTILDMGGAEKLLDKGDSLYAPKDAPKPHRVQCAFVADGEVEAIMNHLRKFSDGSCYDASVMEEIERAAQKCSKKGDRGDRDDDGDNDGDSNDEGYLNNRQFLDAVEVAVNTRKISTSLIQRKLSIGYGKAAKFIDIMEDMGIVGEANGQRPREVLLTPDEWREKLARASFE